MPAHRTTISPIQRIVAEQLHAFEVVGAQGDELAGGASWP